MTITNLDFDSEILEAAVAPKEATLSPPVAKAVLSIKFTDKQQQEVQKLLDKNNAGTITPRQKEKLESYVRIGNLLNILKIKAQTSLEKSGSKR
jgi:hypothetical protein